MDERRKAWIDELEEKARQIRVHIVRIAGMSDCHTPGHAEGTVWERQENGDYRLLYPYTPAGAAPLQYRVTDPNEKNPQTPRKELDT